MNTSLRSISAALALIAAFTASAAALSGENLSAHAPATELAMIPSASAVVDAPALPGSPRAKASDDHANWISPRSTNVSWNHALIGGLIVAFVFAASPVVRRSFRS